MISTIKYIVTMSFFAMYCHVLFKQNFYKMLFPRATFLYFFQFKLSCIQLKFYKFIELIVSKKAASHTVVGTLFRANFYGNCRIEVVEVFASIFCQHESLSFTIQRKLFRQKFPFKFHSSFPSKIGSGLNFLQALSSCQVRVLLLAKKSFSFKSRRSRREKGKNFDGGISGPSERRCPDLPLEGRSSSVKAISSRSVRQPPSSAAGILHSCSNQRVNYSSLASLLCCFEFPEIKLS